MTIEAPPTDNSAGTHLCRHSLGVGTVFALAAGIWACSAPPPAPAGPLKSANATLPAEFTWVGSVRELADGRLLIGDQQENRLFVADSALKAVTEIGHKGDGPGEYRGLGRIWPIGGDSSLISDREIHRSVIVVGAEPVATLPPSDPAMHAIGASYGFLTGADSIGTIAGQIFNLKSRSLSDSTFLVRVNRATGRSDTLTRLGNGEGAAGEAAGSDAPTPEKPRYSVGLITSDRSAAFLDGWIAVARGNPYRVDWCQPAQPCRPGPVLERLRSMNDREKTAYLAYTARTSKWPPTSKLDETFDWPKILPPFVTPNGAFDSSPLLTLPGGSLLVERLPSADVLDRRFDVVSRSGEVTRRLAMPISQRIVGAGRGVVFLVTTNDDGVQHLSRHPWP